MKTKFCDYKPVASRESTHPRKQLCHQRVAKLARNCGNSVIVHFMKLIRLFKTCLTTQRDFGARHKPHRMVMARALFFVCLGTQTAACPGDVPTEPGQDLAQVGIFYLFDISLACWGDVGFGHLGRSMNCPFGA